MDNLQGVATAQILMFARNGWVPNNPRLPVIIYPKAIAIQGTCHQRG